MSLLNPLALLGLLALIVPIILHLIRRSETQQREWAAMQFLMEKESHSMKKHSIREWLLLLARLLLLLFLILALAQPLGRLFSFGEKTPEAIFLLLDRSAEMGASSSEQFSLMDDMLEKLEEDLSGYGRKTRFYLIDSAELSVTPLLDVANLPLLSQSAVVDTPASIPEMVGKALGEIESGEFGKTECWIISQRLQEVWNPEDSGWDVIAQRMEQSSALKSVTFRHLTKSVPQGDLRLSMESATLGEVTVNLMLNIVGGNEGQLVRLLGKYGDAQSFTRELTLKAGQVNYSLSLELPKDYERTVLNGTIELPQDSNLLNNTASFACGDPQDLWIYLVANNEQDISTKNLMRAAGLESRAHQKVRWISPSDFLLTDLSQCNLLLWSASGGNSSYKQHILEFVEAGGQAIVFPHTEFEDHQEGWFFSEVKEAAQEEYFTIGRWNELDGPWRNSQSKEKLPLNVLQAAFIATPQYDGMTPLAHWSSGDVATARAFVGAGVLYLVSTHANYTWSNLENLGLHLVMIQRVLQEVSAQKGGGYMQFLQSTERIQEVSVVEGQAYNRPPFTSYEELSESDINALLKRYGLDSRGKASYSYRSWITPFLFVALIFLLVEALLQSMQKKPQKGKEVKRA